jgi:mRNA interferase RelE/StbE
VAYTVRLLPSAAREFAKLPHAVQARITPAIDELKDNPRPDGRKKLADGDGIYRVRVGGYRVLYEIDDDRRILEVLVVKVGSRSDVYRYLQHRRRRH